MSFEKNKADRAHFALEEIINVPVLILLMACLQRFISRYFPFDRAGYGAS
jgi:hypothetical protein